MCGGATLIPAPPEVYPPRVIRAYAECLLCRLAYARLNLLPALQVCFARAYGITRNFYLLTRQTHCKIFHHFNGLLYLTRNLFGELWKKYYICRNRGIRLIWGHNIHEYEWYLKNKYYKEE